MSCSATASSTSTAPRSVASPTSAWSRTAPCNPPCRPRFRVDGLIVVEKRVTRLFGYERHVRPALLRWLVHRHLGTVWYLPWTDIARISPTTVEARSPLKPLEETPRI